MSDVPAPGWYHAEGDPPNTQRYWDGSQWQGGPQPMAAPSASEPPPTYGAAPGAAYAPGGVAVSWEPSESTRALVFSLLGLLCCGILAPFGWYSAQQELDGIDAGRRDPSNRGVAMAAKIVGIIATVLWALGVAANILFYFAR